MATEKTKKLRQIQPSSPWHKWKAGINNGDTPAGKKRFPTPKRKKKKFLGYDETDPDNVVPVMGSCTKANTAERKFLDRQARRLRRKAREEEEKK